MEQGYAREGMDTVSCVCGLTVFHRLSFLFFSICIPVPDGFLSSSGRTARGRVAAQHRI